MYKAFKASVLAFALYGLSGCGGSDEANKVDGEASELPQPILPPPDPAEQSISPNFDFRFSTFNQMGLVGDVVGQRAVLSSRDPAIYNLRYIVVNGRDNCFLYPVERIGKGIIRFDLIENVGDDEKIFEGTVAIRTGDQIQLGRLINLSMAYGNREFISYQQCGRPSTLTILTDEGKADLQIFISGD
jgi:hypothetical protein